MTDVSGNWFGRPARLAVIGGGRMGEAIVAGMLSAGVVGREHVVVAEPSEARRRKLKETLDLNCVERAEQAVDGATIILLAVKPQIIEQVVSEIAGKVGDALILSIAAGITCARLEALLPDATPVVRVMPNAPVLAGGGMSVISAGTHAIDSQVELVSELFGSVGKSVVLPESFQDVATAISGCGPAYVAIVIDALARAGVRHGLSRDVAQLLATQTLRGTIDLLDKTGMHPGELADVVASPGGVTAAAIEVLESSGVRKAFADTVTAAINRSRELNK